MQPMAEIPDGLSPQRRARILAGAAEIFVAEGYEGASMSKIAASANVSKGTLYNYFPSKPSLFAAFVRERCGHFMEEVLGDLQEDAPVASELRRIGGLMLKMMIAPGAQSVFRVVVMEAAKFPELAKTYMVAGPEALLERVTAWLAAQNRVGTLSMPDPQFASEQFFALAQTRLVLRSRVDPDYRASDSEIDRVLDGAVAVFMAAYGVK
jgi:TetR/AcrR family transcriptional repressor of mexJK operon